MALGFRGWGVVLRGYHTKKLTVIEPELILFNPRSSALKTEVYVGCGGLGA